MASPSWTCPRMPSRCAELLDALHGLVPASKPPLGAVGTSSCRLRHLQAISSTLLGSLGSLVVFNISDNALDALPSQIGLLRCAMVHKVQMSRAASITSSIPSHEQRRSHAQQPCPVATNATGYPQHLGNNLLPPAANCVCWTPLATSWPRCPRVCGSWQTLRS